MASYAKGANAERELIEMFWNNGYAAMRAAGSGVSRFPSADVIASNGEKTFAIESKAIKSGYVYLERDEIVKLLEFSQKFGARPYVAVKIKKDDWTFLPAGKIIATESGNFSITKKSAKENGILFENLISAT